LAARWKKESIISFLLWRETTGNENLDGTPRVRKSTFVEHVRLDKRVRYSFSLIVFFSGNDLKGGNLATLRGSGLNLLPHHVETHLLSLSKTGHGRGNMEANVHLGSKPHDNRKIILMSRSDKIASFGTAHALILKFLPQEAYWYFFKTLAFGSRNPEEHSNLAALSMEIAVHMNRSFMAANTVAGIPRANLDGQFWCKMLRCLRDFASKLLSMIGEHPTDLL
jgi:hypothetical protein